MKRKILVFVSIAVLVSLLGFSLGYTLKKEPSKLGSVRVTLLVKQYRNGKLIKQIIQKNDPFTRNFVNLMWALLKPNGGTFTMVDTSGTTRTLNLHNPNNYYHVPLYAANNKIAIGTGTAAFSIDDYNLASLFASTPSSEPSESIIGNQINYTISASFSIDSAVDITEVGYIRTLRNPYGNYDFLLMRDVLPSPISAQAGDTVTVTYIIQVNT